MIRISEDMSSNWPTNAKYLAKELHSILILNDSNWHKLKNDSNRRAAELISAAIVQLLSNGEKSDIEELLSQSKRWLNKEIIQPSCPKR